MSYETNETSRDDVSSLKKDPLDQKMDIEHSSDIPTEPEIQDQPRKLSEMELTAIMVNFFFATSPFTYPYPFIMVGPLISIPLIIGVGVLGYYVSEFMIEVLFISDQATMGGGQRTKEISKKMELTSMTSLQSGNIYL
jgi:hypothetical protein